MIAYSELLVGWFGDLKRRLAHRRMLKQAMLRESDGFNVEFIGPEAGFYNAWEVPAVPLEKVLNDPHGGYTFRASYK